MKNILTTLLIAFITTSLFSQKITSESVDEITGLKIKTTSYHDIVYGKQYIISAGLSKMADEYYVRIKMMSIYDAGDIYSIDKDDHLIFKFDNDHVIKMKAVSRSTTCRGCGSKGLSGSGTYGISQSYKVTKEDLKYFLNNNLVFVRAETNDGDHDGKTRTKKWYQFQEAVKLIKD